MALLEKPHLSNLNRRGTALNYFARTRCHEVSTVHEKRTKSLFPPLKLNILHLSSGRELHFFLPPARTKKISLATDGGTVLLVTQDKYSTEVAAGCFEKLAFIVLQFSPAGLLTKVCSTT